MAPEETQSELTSTEEEALITEGMKWEASEFIHHQKQGMWYVLFAVVVVALVAVAAITQQWFSVAVFIAMAGALLMYSNKAPRVLTYEINDKGVKIDTKFYNFSQFRSFSVVTDVGWHSIDLDPTQRFMPRLTILFESEDFDKIVKLLSKELPRADRHPDLIERITRKLKF